MDAKLLADPAVRPIRRLLKLVSDQLPLLLGAQLPAGQVQRPSQGPLLLFRQSLLDDFWAFVAKLVGDTSMNGLPPGQEGDWAPLSRRQWHWFGRAFDCHSIHRGI